MGTVANSERWASGDFVAEFASRDLRPAETVALIRHREVLSGRVLELGCGAGRLTGYLAVAADRVDAIDISPAMVAHCRRRYPGVACAVGDLRDLAGHASGTYDAVVAAFNVLGILDETERRQVLAEIHRVLVENGTLIMSSHNRAFIPRLHGPWWVLSRDPAVALRRLGSLPRRVRNRRRLAPRQRAREGYAIVNDDALDYSMLHYYVAPADQAAQLGELGFELVEALDGDGERVDVAAGETAAGSSSIYFVARAA